MIVQQIETRREKKR